MKKKLLIILLLGSVMLNQAFAQSRIITGKVTDAQEGYGLPGVTVTVKETKHGSLTDANGTFSVNAKTGDVLSFTFIGYATVEVPVTDGKSDYAISLKTDTRVLTEVVVTDGYGVQSKKSYTGSASAVSGKINEDKPFTSPMLALQGEVPGLNVSSNSGQPGANVQVRLRGVGSISAGSNPLYVLDGTIINAGDLSQLTTTSNVLAGINNDDIESITVLKDASATAIYGSRGSNGVIVITTKKGKAGKTQVSLDAEAGSSTNIPMPEAGRPLTGPEYRTLVIEGLTNAGYDQPTIDQLAQTYVSGPSNNWYNIVTRNGYQRQYNASVRGGSDNTKVFASGGYFEQNATTIGSNLKRFTTLFNIEHNISKKITLNAGFNVSAVDQHTPSNGGAFSNPIGSAYFLTPFQLARNPDGSINSSSETFPNGSSNYNPLFIVANDKNILHQTRELGNVSLKYNIVSTLKFTSYVGVDYDTLEETVFNNPIMGDGVTSGGIGYDDYTRYFNYVLRNQFDYRYNIKGVQDFYIDLTAGYEAQKSQADYIQATSKGYPATQPLLTESTNAAVPVLGTGTFSNYTFDSFYARGTINFQNKYSLSGSFRRDGSSVFGINEPYGSFYSVGGAWNIDQEDFFKEQRVFSSAKLRSSIGTNGNAPTNQGTQGSGNYSAQPTAGYGNNYAGANGQNFNTIGNTALTWESSQKFDVGADFGFFNDRLSFTVDYYHNNISKLIQNVPLSYTTGFSSITANIGAMVNKGFEFSVTGVPLKTRDFSWTTNFNISLNHNTVTKLTNDQPYVDPVTGAFHIEEGKDLYTFYTRQYAGVDPATGDALWYTDASKKTTTTDYSAAARIDEKQADPKAFGGFNNTFKYKGFTLSADFYFNYGNYINDSWAQYFTDGTYNIGINKYQYVYDHRWTHPGQITDVPKYVDGGTNDGQASLFSDRFLYKGDFIRLRNLSIGYDFKDLGVLKSLGLSKLYLYGRGTNLWTKTYDNRLPFDPEVGINGISNLEVPQVRTFTIGLNVGL
jgi:TonB-dependent starch-binding outer membrane protein SusC